MPLTPEEEAFLSGNLTPEQQEQRRRDEEAAQAAREAAYARNNSAEGQAATARKNARWRPKEGQYAAINRDNQEAPGQIVTDPMRGGFDARINPDTRAVTNMAKQGQYSNLGFRGDSGDVTKQMSDSYLAQQALIQKYHTLAAGDSNSIAQQALQQSIRQAQQSSMVLAAQRRGVSAGTQLRAGERAGEAIQGQGYADSALLMKQEQEKARQALAQLYAAQRGGDLGASNAMADVGGAQQSLNDAYQGFNQGLYAQGIENDRRAGLDQLRTQAGLDTNLRTLDSMYADKALNTAGGATASIMKVAGDEYARK